MKTVLFAVLSCVVSTGCAASRPAAKGVLDPYLSKGLGTYPFCSNNATDKVLYDSVNQFHCGDDQKGGTFTATPSVGARSLNATFVPSTTTYTALNYSVAINCTATLAGGQNGTVQLLSDTASPPTTVRATARNENSVALAIALTAINNQTIPLSYLAPPNHNVRLATSFTGNSCTMSIVSQTEQPLTVL